MKIVKIIFLSAVLCSFGYSNCYYAPCDYQVSTNEKQSQTEIEASFQKVKAKLEILEQNYQAQLDELIKANENLEKQIALSKNTLLEQKELLFLLKQANQLESNTINQDALKEKE